MINVNGWLLFFCLVLMVIVGLLWGLVNRMIGTVNTVKKLIETVTNTENGSEEKKKE